ncbi:MAG: glycosyltransferase [Opitutaceae bacterium]|nr:glycosyltransferase [Opitutaceae bacterium]MBP9911800.1 glycosyltransferase [Opitutaceae bacterium]
MKPLPRLAIVASHPVQYYAPWFQQLAQGRLDLRVFYLWDGGIVAHHDPGFDREIKWDLDLLSGYEHEFVPNASAHPGTGHFSGLHNPSLVKHLESWRPDAVLVFGYGWRSLAQLALTWRRCPLFLRGDTHLVGRENAPVLRRLVRRILLSILLRRYRGFASVGEAHTRFLTAYGVPAGRIFHVPHCVDNHRWASQTNRAGPEARQLREKLGIPSHHNVILFAGKFETKKRPDLLLSAFREANLTDTSLLLVGGGPLSARLQAEAKELDHVHFLPFQNQLSLPYVFAISDLLVLPSEGPGETWGLVVNEAMAAGLPCIVSDHVGCRENLIVEGVTGWSFPHGNANSLARCLQSAVATLQSQRPALDLAVRAHIAHYDYATATAALLSALAATVPAFKV